LMFETGEMPVGFHQSVLQHIFGLLGIAQDAAGQVIQRVPVLFNQLAERFAVPRKRFLNQSVVIKRRWFFESQHWRYLLLPFTLPIEEGAEISAARSILCRCLSYMDVEGTRRFCTA